METKKKRTFLFTHMVILNLIILFTHSDLESFWHSILLYWIQTNFLQHLKCRDDFFQLFNWFLVFSFENCFL